MNGPRRLAVGALALLLALAGLGVATARRGDPAVYPAAEGSSGITVYVTENGFHSDLSVPTAVLVRGGGPIAAAVAHLRPQPWTALGWGDAVFYQGQGFGPGRALDLLHSALWPWNASVVHVGGDPDPTHGAGDSRVLRLRVSEEGLARLKRRLDASFALDRGRPVALAALRPPGGGPPDALFFRSGENAWALHVCNHWTGELLHAAGAPITPVLDLSAWGLARDLEWRARATPLRPVTSEAVRR